MQNAFHHLSPDDLGKLLDSDDVYLDLDIPDNLFGPDGHVLLDTDFGSHPKEQQFPHVGHHQFQEHRHAPSDAGMNQQQQQQQHQQQNEQTLDAARSVLASLDSTMQQEQSNLTMQHAHSAPQLAGMPMHGGSMGSYMNTQQPMFIRDAQGNFIQVNNPPMQPMYLSGVPYQPGHVHYFVHHQQVPSMSYGQVPVYESASVQNSPRKSPGKRRRQRKSTETVQQRSARAESGYTQDPLTGHMLRHGPALMATARDNKEVPAIKAMFQTFEKSGGFAQPPSSPFVGIQIGDTTQHGVGGPGGINIEADATGAPGNQSITTMVTKELRSFNPKETEMQEQETSSQTANMRGVSRDKWSLFWDAHFERPSPKSDGDESEDKKGSLVDELKKDVIFIGKFPAKDQAARAHDLVALKVLGEDAELNFPKETYRATLPIVQAHTEEEVIRAILKDSELARQRTSKYKGVRRTGPGQFEALIDAEVASGKHGISEHCHMNTIHVPHNTETFNA